MLDNLFKKKKKPMVKLVINVSEDYFREAAKIKMDEMEDGSKEKFLTYFVENAIHARFAKEIEEGTREFNIYEGGEDPFGAVRMAVRGFAAVYNLQKHSTTMAKIKIRKESKPMNLMGKPYTLVEGEPEGSSLGFPCSKCALSGFLGHCENHCVHTALRLGYDPKKSYFRRYEQNRP